MRMFLERGFEHTTLEAIAEAADISRRTFFHYFGSKEAILEAVDDGLHEAFREALSVEGDISPLAAVKVALLQMIGRYQSKEAIALDNLMRSTEALRARKQAGYERRERALFAALCERWTASDRQPALRMVAMVSIGAMRVATERWRDDPERESLAAQLERAFADLEVELGR